MVAMKAYPGPTASLPAGWKVMGALGGDRRTAWLITLFELTLVVALLLTRD